MKKYILIAGVNGAGKSTLYQSLDYLKSMDRVNTDEIVKEFGVWKNPKDVIKAGRIAVKKINANFSKGKTFNQETTLFGNNILKNIDRAKQIGYNVEMHYVGVETVDIAKSRISYRVAHGGHGISDKDVERRYNNSFYNLSKVIEKCNLLVLYDNSIAFKQFAIYKNGKIVYLLEDYPKWFKRFLKL
mgnify:FL=1